MHRTPLVMVPGVPGHPASRPGWWRALAILGLVALLFGVLDAFQMRAQWEFSGYPGGLRQALLAAVPPWMILVALTPGVWVMSSRFRLDRGPRTRHILAHVGAAFVFAVLHVGFQSINAVTLGGYDEGLTSAAGHLAGLYFVSRLLTYGALTAGVHAVLLYREARARELATSHLTTQLHEARLDALQRQLNPHFLFNALNGIGTLALRGEREAVVDGLSQVSDMLRITLDGDLPPQIPLSRELDLVNRFLGLQTLRFGDRLTVHQVIEPDTMAGLVPCMVLQPLVENAVDHGVARVPGPGVITIRSRRDGDTFRIEIADSGPGFPDKGQRAPETGTGRRKGGIGLDNTRARLAQLHGDKGTLQLGHGPEGGAIVTLTLPYRT